MKTSDIQVSPIHPERWGDDNMEWVTHSENSKRGAISRYKLNENSTS